MTRGSAAIAVGILCASGCTDARLFGIQSGGIEADRVTLSGRVCTEDPAKAQLPLKVVIVADRAAGPLYSTFDPAGMRVNALNALVQSALMSENVSLAVVSYAGRARKLAPVEGNFTRNPGELLNAVNQLGISEPCSATNQCRDYLEGLRSARALIEGDIAETPAGDRVVTQYVVLFLVAGPHVPYATNLDCCAITDATCLSAMPVADPGCQVQREQAELTSMLDSADAAGALGLKMHVIHFAADPAPSVNDTLADSMEELSFLTGGTYQRFANISLLAPRNLDLLESRTPLRAKTLYAANLNARPSPSGPLVDSDADGLSDAEEDALGTSPIEADTDGDGVTDFVESVVDYDPLTPTMPPACVQVDLMADSDLDGLTDCDEAVLGTEGTLVDTDGDGTPDPLELRSFVDYLHSDGELDADGDGTPNGDEVRIHTDPRSTDTRSQLRYGYRYEFEDEGSVEELFATELVELTGVELVDPGAGTTPGVGTIEYNAANQTLTWQDADDMTPGPAVDVSEDGEFTLPSSSWNEAQGEDGKVVHARVSTVNLPLDDVTEDVRVIFRTRHCIDYAVRNIRLMDTLETPESNGPGENRILLFFAESPQNRLTGPGPFRLAEVPVVFRPPNRRTPSAPVLTVFDEEFVRARR